MRTARPDIMVVEDEAMIGYDLVDLLSDAGYSVSGPHATSDEALTALAGGVGLAILDVNLGDGRTSQTVAERLTSDGTPILFISGYTSAGSEVIRAFPQALQVEKPWDPAQLLALVRSIVRPTRMTRMARLGAQS